MLIGVHVCPPKQHMGPSDCHLGCDHYQAPVLVTYCLFGVKFEHQKNVETVTFESPTETLN